MMKFDQVAGAAFVLLLSFFVFSTAFSEPAHACSSSANWKENGLGLYVTHGCFTADETIIEYDAMAFVTSKFDLELVGPAPDGRPLSDGELDNLKNRSVLLKEYSLLSVHRRNKQHVALVPIGYPAWNPTRDYKDDIAGLIEAVDHSWLSIGGYLRLKTTEYAEADLVASFKSSYLCLHESEKVSENRPNGSIMVMFNAYEDYLPVRRNKRLENPNNCEDVIQTGPRIVEYRAIKGVKAKSGKKNPRNWIIIAQGNGGVLDKQYLAYIVYFKTGATLDQIQQLLLTENALSPYDKEMRFALVLTSGNFANASILDHEMNPVPWRKMDLPHPVYLGIKPSELN